MRTIVYLIRLLQSLVCRLRYVVVLALVILLTGCNAMDVYSPSGRMYNNDEDGFYIPEKRARIGVRSHAYRWKQDQLEGFCSVEKSRQQKVRDDEQLTNGSIFQATLVDEVLLTEDVSVLFDTDSSDLNPIAMSILGQFVDRLSAYENVLDIRLEGHTDSRASDAYNAGLSARRNASVREYLKVQYGVTHEFVERPFGETSPVAENRTPEGLQKNRRVVARIRALSVTPENTNPTICYPLPKYVNTPKIVAFSQAKPIGNTGEVVAPDGLPVSGGDQISLSVSADDAFKGVYKVNMAGNLVLPLLGAIRASGLTTEGIQQKISEELVEKELMQPYLANVDLTIQQWAPVEVYVRGAVFLEGRVTINAKSAAFAALNPNTRSGDYSSGRLLSEALRKAGGIRPDANISNIILIRDGNRTSHDFSGLFSGQKVEDVALIFGDEVVVPTTGLFQGALVRPSQVTPPDMVVYMSNPTVPILNNTSAAIDADGTKLPYGARLLRALVSANCVGGSQETNAPRRAVLISSNPLTGATEVIERSIQQLVSDPDRDDINPHVMPNDGIACYDSSVTNLRALAGTLSEVLAPFKDLRVLFQIP